MEVNNVHDHTINDVSVYQLDPQARFVNIHNSSISIS